MNTTLSHRGPDGEGYFLQNNVGLAHRRLSVIDLSPNGNQPVFNEDQSIAVVFNGEIYNFRELKRELEKLGHTFKTQTDTETIAHAYEQWGLGCLEKLDGMFSFALFDSNTKKLFIAKDPFGKKPLYYTFFEKVFLFASELKAFFKFPGFKKVLSPQTVSQYLAYDYIPAPLTALENCWKLQGGEHLVIETENIHSLPTPKKYWQPTYLPKTIISENEAITEFERLFQLAIEKRLISDVPLGVFLSGGLDSSAILAYLARFLSPKKIKTFTIGFEDKSYDESPFADEVASTFGTDHCRTILSQNEVINIFPSTVQMLDEPFADPSVIPTFLLCRIAKKSITVALGGDGGDELLAGYDTFTAHKFSTLYDQLPSVAANILSSLARLLPRSENNMSLDFKIKYFLKGLKTCAKKKPELRNNLWMSPFTQEMQSSLFQGTQTPLNLEKIYAPTFLQMQISTARGKIDRVVDNFIHIYLHNDILYKVDRASMLNSLEVRSPFLDKDLGLFLNRLPEDFKIRGFTRKYLLRKALENKLPARILSRPKKGFGLPIARWLKGPLKEILLDTLAPDRLKFSPFNTAFTQKLVHDHLSSQADNRKELWSLLVLECWRKENEVSWI